LPRRPPRSSDDTLSLRETFDQVPELYDWARPGYPTRLFYDLAELTQLRPSHASSKSAVAPAKRPSPGRARYRITCVELGERLAALAREKLAR